MPRRHMIGARLAALREAADETQEELAAATGYSRSSVANVEAGGQQIGLQMALAMADHFKVPLDYLLCRAVPPGGPQVGKVVDDPDILAWIGFWERLDTMGRAAILHLIGNNLQHRTGPAAA
jgi:transcriptional regulator with XRE-family HTH domain